jgi:hypothetical protein
MTRTLLQSLLLVAVLLPSGCGGGGGGGGGGDTSGTPVVVPVAVAVVLVTVSGAVAWPAGGVLSVSVDGTPASLVGNQWSADVDLSSVSSRTLDVVLSSNGVAVAHRQVTVSR